MDHILGHKISLSKFKRIETISSIFFNHNGMKLEINYRKKKGKRTKTWRLNNMLLRNKWVNADIKEVRIYLETNENGTKTLQNPLHVAKAVLIGKFIVIQAFLKK